MAGGIVRVFLGVLLKTSNRFRALISFNPELCQILQRVQETRIDRQGVLILFLGLRPFAFCGICSRYVERGRSIGRRKVPSDYELLSSFGEFMLGQIRRP